MNALLIAGTDTEVGKTVLTTALVAYWRQHYGHRRLGLMKPIQCGVGDLELYAELFQDLDQSSEEITPIFFQAPLAPPIAAEQEGLQIDLGTAWSTFSTLTQKRDWVLVEALGGLGSPVTAETTVADLARDWRLPTLLVVPVKLGAISQAVANVALARQSRLQVKGIVLNCVHPCSDEERRNWAPVDLIQTLTQIPVLGTVPYVPDTTDRLSLAQVASRLTLEQIFPS